MLLEKSINVHILDYPFLSTEVSWVLGKGLLMLMDESTAVTKEWASMSRIYSFRFLLPLSVSLQSQALSVSGICF
jgi:hypothetical protein